MPSISIRVFGVGLALLTLITTLLYMYVWPTLYSTAKWRSLNFTGLSTLARAKDFLEEEAKIDIRTSVSCLDKDCNDGDTSNDSSLLYGLPIEATCIKPRSVQGVGWAINLPCCTMYGCYSTHFAKCPYFRAQEVLVISNVLRIERLVPASISSCRFFGVQ